MKKIVLTLLLAAAAWSAAAQRPRTRVEWGVIGGISIPDYTTDMDRTDIRNKCGMRIRPEGGEEVNLKSNSIDVPVLLSLRLLHPVRIYTGPVFTVMNDSKQKSGRDLLDFGRVRPTVSFTVGAGVVLMRHLLVDLRYNGQFRAKHDVVLPDGQQLDKLRSYNVALSFGYLF